MNFFTDGKIYFWINFTIFQVKVVYVRNLSPAIDEGKLTELFTQYGSVEKVKKIKDYAFINFVNRDDALRAIEELDCQELDDMKISVQLAKPQVDKSQHRRGQSGFGALNQRGKMEGGFGGNQGGRGGGNFRGRGGAPTQGYRGGYNNSGGYNNTGGYNGGYNDNYGQSYGGYDDNAYDDYYAPAPRPRGGPSSRGAPNRGGAPRGRGGSRGASTGGSYRGRGGVPARGSPRGAPRGGGGQRGGMSRGGGGMSDYGSGRGASRGGSGGYNSRGRGGAPPKRKAEYNDYEYNTPQKRKNEGWNSQPIAQQPLNKGSSNSCLLYTSPSPRDRG